jgi:hypothetical protein
MPAAPSRPIKVSTNLLPGYFCIIGEEKLSTWKGYRDMPVGGIIGLLVTIIVIVVLLRVLGLI